MSSPSPAGRPRNVLYLTPSVRLLGARRSLLALVSNLDPERWKPIVCGQSTGDLSDSLSELNIPFKVLKTGWWRKGKYFLWRPFAISQLAALIRRHNIDVVHCNEIYPNPYAVRAAARAQSGTGRRIPVVTHMRLTVTPRMVRNYDLAKADLILVVSSGAGADFDIWPDKEKRVKIIHNGVDLTEFRRGRAPGEARRMIGVPGDGPLLAAIGQLSPRKGGDIILEAFRLVLEKIPNARLMFVGNPHRGQEEFAEGLRREVEKCGLGERVTFFPFSKQILPYYEALDLNLLISREEGFGRTIIEAGAVGTPSVGARVGGIPELIADRKTGYLVDPENHAALADAILEYLSDPAAAAQMQERVFRHMAQHFSITSHTEKVMEVYDSFFPQPAEDWRG